MVENEQEQPKSDELYNQMSSIVPQRDVEIPENKTEDENEHGTLGERIDYSPKLTDLQVADKRLNPDLGYKHLNVIEMSRVFPDIYNPLFRILVKDLMRNSSLRLAEAIAFVNTGLSIAIDGEGRIDEIRIMGKVVEAEAEKNKLTGI